MKRDGVWPMNGDPADPFIELPEVEAVAPGDLVRPVTVAQADLPTFEEMARVAADYAPGAGNEAPDRVLGPWVDRLSVSVREERRLLLLALAAACFFAPDDDFRSPFLQWSRRAPAPSMRDRNRFRAVAQAGFGVWSVESDDLGPRQVVSTLVAASNVQPPQVFPVEHRAVLPGRVPKFFVGRSVRTNEGWVLALGVGMERTPSSSLIRDLLRTETAGVELQASDACLRWRGHRFVRLLAEYEFLFG